MEYHQSNKCAAQMEYSLGGISPHFLILLVGTTSLLLVLTLILWNLDRRRIHHLEQVNLTLMQQIVDQHKEEKLEPALYRPLELDSIQKSSNNNQDEQTEGCILPSMERDELRVTICDEEADLVKDSSSIVLSEVSHELPNTDGKLVISGMNKDYESGPNSVLYCKQKVDRFISNPSYTAAVDIITSGTLDLKLSHSIIPKLWKVLEAKRYADAETIAKHALETNELSDLMKLEGCDVESPYVRKAKKRLAMMKLNQSLRHAIDLKDSDAITLALAEVEGFTANMSERQDDDDVVEDENDNFMQVEVDLINEARLALARLCSTLESIVKSFECGALEYDKVDEAKLQEAISQEMWTWEEHAGTLLRPADPPSLLERGMDLLVTVQCKKALKKALDAADYERLRQELYRARLRGIKPESFPEFNQCDRLLRFRDSCSDLEKAIQDAASHRIIDLAKFDAGDHFSHRSLDKIASNLTKAVSSAKELCATFGWSVAANTNRSCLTDADSDAEREEGSTTVNSNANVQSMLCSQYIICEGLILQARKEWYQVTMESKMSDILLQFSDDIVSPFASSSHQSNKHHHQHLIPRMRAVILEYRTHVKNGWIPASSHETTPNALMENDDGRQQHATRLHVLVQRVESKLRLEVCKQILSEFVIRTMIAADHDDSSLMLSDHFRHGRGLNFKDQDDEQKDGSFSSPSTITEEMLNIKHHPVPLSPSLSLNENFSIVTLRGRIVQTASALAFVEETLTLAICSGLIRFVQVQQNHLQELSLWLNLKFGLENHVMQTLRQLGMTRVDDLKELSEGDLRQCNVQRLIAKRILPQIVEFGKQASSEVELIKREYQNQLV